MRALSRRLAAIERARRKPLASILVIRPGQDEAAELAAFRQAHGREPWRVFSVKRAPPRQ